jgi:PAS domain S-box-containing protein
MFEDDIPTNVLLVDDQPQNLIALEAILEPLGQTLVKATSGAEALKQVLRNEFACILMDVQMPEMDGFETAELIKARDKSRNIPIIFVTAISKEEEYVFRGYNVGAVDYIFKPINADILRSKVLVFIDLYRKNERIRRQAELLRQRRERDLAELRRASEQRYRTLAESMPQIVWTADAQGALTYCNDRWFACAGGIEAGATTEWGSVLHPEDLPRFTRQWGEAVRRQENWEAEFRFGSPATGFRWHLVRALPVRNDDGEVASWIGTSTDIDDRRRAEQSLRLLAEASTVLASSMDYATTLTDVGRLVVPQVADGFLVQLQDEEGKLLPATVVYRDEDRAQSVREFLERTPAAKLAGFGAGKVVVSGEPDIDLRSTRSSDIEPRADGGAGGKLDGDPKRLFSRVAGAYVCAPIISRRKMLGALTFTADDASQRFDDATLVLAQDLARRAAAAIDNAQLFDIVQRDRQHLEEANRAKDEFLATLSHELRTPLNAILGWTQLLRGEALDDDTYARGLETIERNTKSQAQLIADLLDVSRIITGKLHLEMRPVELAPIVEAAIDAVRPQIAAKHLHLETRIHAAPFEIEGDPDRIQQVVWNLLSNAIKFTPAEGTIVVSLEREGRAARIVVRDSGKGIDPSFLPYVFDRFRQADSTSTRVHGGLGLGLAIVKHLVQLHRGQVSADSLGEGKGAEFRVELPVREGVRAVRTPAAAPSETTLRPSSTELNGVHVLVVEDEPDGREMITAVLERRGAHVTAVTTVAEALASLEQSFPDVLLSDIGLPGEDGYALIRRVRSLPTDKARALPAVALTAYASTQDRERVASAGFQAHVSKPVEPAELTAIVARFCGRA